MTSEDTDPGSVAIEADWSVAQTTPVLLANQFVVQLGVETSSLKHPVPDGVYLIVGEVAPPVLVGSPERQREQAERLQGRIPIQVHGRFFMTRERLGELITLLEETRMRFDAAVARGAE